MASGEKVRQDPRLSGHQPRPLGPVYGNPARAWAAGIVEVAPQAPLVGLAKRAMRGVPGTSINTPEDLASLKG